MISIKNILGLILIFFATFLHGQNPVFRVNFKDWTTNPIPNNASFVQLPTPGIPVGKDFDVTNLTASTQQIIIKKTEVQLNVLSLTDYGLASYCIGPVCNNASIFVDTITFLPNQKQTLEIDYIEASAIGQSKVIYSVQNKNNPSEIINIIMYYQGPVSVDEMKKKNLLQIEWFPNPTKETINLSSNNLDNRFLNISIYNNLGELVLKQNGLKSLQENFHINLMNLKSGLYTFITESENQILDKSMILIE